MLNIIKKILSCHRYDQSAVNIILSTLNNFTEEAYGWRNKFVAIERTEGRDDPRYPQPLIC